MTLPPCPHCGAGSGEVCTPACIAFAIELVLGGGFDVEEDTRDYEATELERLLKLVVSDAH